MYLPVYITDGAVFLNLGNTVLRLNQFFKYAIYYRYTVNQISPKNYVLSTILQKNEFDDQKTFFFVQYDESIKIKSELQNAVDRLRQKLYDLELHGQEKQNKYTIDKQQWEIQRVELTGKTNEVKKKRIFCFK